MKKLFSFCLLGRLAAQTAVDAQGGINGRQVRFGTNDDGSNLQTALQLATGIVASRQGARG